MDGFQFLLVVMGFVFVLIMTAYIVDAWVDVRDADRDSRERIELLRMEAEYPDIDEEPEHSANEGILINEDICSRADAHDGPCNGLPKPSCRRSETFAFPSNNPEPEAL